MTQCRLDTNESRREIWFDGSRPTDSSSSVRGKVLPLSGPASASRRAGPEPRPSESGSCVTGRVYQPPISAASLTQTRGHLTLSLGGSGRAPGRAAPSRHTLLVISIVFIAKHEDGIYLPLLVTFGTSLALLKCVTAVETETDFRRKEKPNES